MRKGEIIFAYFPSPEVTEQIRLLSRTEQMIAYTPLAVLRGTFHFSAEARPSDFLSTWTSILLPVTDAELFLSTALPAPFPARCDLLLVGRAYIQLYHPAR